VRIYLSARYPRREEMCGYADELRADGHTVDARWLAPGHELTADCSVERGSTLAVDDTEDIIASDCLIAFTEDPAGEVPGAARGGRHVEFGFGIGLGSRGPGDFVPLRLVVVGYRENVFHYLPEVEFFPTWAEARAALRRQKKEGVK
jgi:hypothetical protein